MATTLGVKLEELNSVLLSEPRLAAVRKTELVDTPAEPSFDRLTELAAKILGTPVAFLSLIEESRDYYKSIYGLPEVLIPNRAFEGRTFCHYTILSEGPLVLNDVSGHPVFSEVPAARALGVRSYIGVPLRNSEGHCIGSFCVVDFQPREWPTRDIDILSELAQAAMREIKLGMALRELKKKAEEARYAAMAREEFLARVAHDLRNPLSAASIGIALLEFATLTEKEMRALQMTRQVLDSMNAIVGDLLNISQFESGKFVLRRTRVDAATLLHDALEVLQGLAESHEIELDIQVTDLLPTVDADYERVLRVFSNLVGNAVKFCDPGSAVILRAYAQDDFVRFEVKDEGPGIAPENIARLFDRYWQSDDADQRGLGLGLSIVKAIIEAHGGEVGVDSTLGDGSTFWFTLPRESGQIPETPFTPLWH